LSGVLGGWFLFLRRNKQNAARSIARTATGIHTPIAIFALWERPEDPATPAPGDAAGLVVETEEVAALVPRLAGTELGVGSVFAGLVVFTRAFPRS
jgi:hypothetical protein